MQASCECVFMTRREKVLQHHLFNSQMRLLDKMKKTRMSEMKCLEFEKNVKSYF